MLIFTVFFILGLIVIGSSLFDVLDEQKFLKTAKEAAGDIVGVIGAKAKTVNHTPDLYGAMQHQGAGNYNRSYLVVKYTTEEGKTYQRQSTKSYTGKIDLKRKLPVSYNPKQPKDAMIDGHYKVSLGHKIRIGIGAVFSVASIIGILTELL